MKAASSLIARVLIALIFVWAGYNKIGGFEGTATALAGLGIPLPEVATVITIIVEIVGGLFIIIGWQARYASLALFLFLIPTTWLIHNGFQDPKEMVNMMKNLAIMGGLLMIFVHGPGTMSLDKDS